MSGERLVAVSTTAPPSSVMGSRSANEPDTVEPRECSVVESYLHDPSLRYTSVAFAGPSVLQAVLMMGGFVAGLALFVTPIVRQLSLSEFSFWSLASILGIPICLELLVPLRDMWRELHHRLRFRVLFRPVELGLERAVPQPATTLRYEIHLSARRKVKLDAVQMRLVFWESWQAQSRLRFFRLPRRSIEKQGHDLVRQQMGPIQLDKKQHAVIRGSIRIPVARPSEHHRGKRKHISYVNLTITLESQRPGQTIRGNCPHLVTFPWM